ncbi:MAG: RNA-guided endonuclease TnpB family protein, partial [Candidatus Asgardarchaeia archaeon]
MINLELNKKSFKLCNKLIKESRKLNIGTLELQGTYDLNHYWLPSIKRVRIVRRADGYYVQFVISGISRVLLRKQTNKMTAIDVGLE